jgi:hypothetical protein
MYVETPKVGCSTIKSLLIRAELDYDFEFSDLDHIHERNLSPLLNPRQVGNFSEFIKKDMFKFCFVRNPYSRLLSSYLDQVVNAKHYKISTRGVRELGIGPEGRCITFPEFVEAVMQQSIDRMDAHWRLQYYQTFQDSLSYDFIGRLERFSEDMRFVCGKIGIDFDKWCRGVVAHATNADNRLDEFYDQRLRDLVYSKYRTDFEHFGYLA